MDSTNRYRYLWIGGIVFFSAVVAPSVFGVLSPVAGGRHLAGDIVNRSLGALHMLHLGFDLLRAGSVLVPSLVLLSAMGWALGLMVRAALLRFGTNAEVLAWSVAFLIQPVAAVFYPVSSLPGWLQTVAHLVPASYVFEALRAYLDHGAVLIGQLVIAAALDVAYLVVGGWLAAVAFQAVRRRGLLARPGY